MKFAGRDEVKPIASYVPVDIYNSLRKNALDQDTSIAKIVAKLIKDYIAKLDKKTK